MRALGIPNTKDFYEVTKIEDAMALWKTQQARQVRCEPGPRSGPRRGARAEGLLCGRRPAAAEGGHPRAAAGRALAPCSARGGAACAAPPPLPPPAPPARPPKRPPSHQRHRPNHPQLLNTRPDGRLQPRDGRGTGGPVWERVQQEDIRGPAAAGHNLIWRAAAAGGRARRGVCMPSAPARPACMWRARMLRRGAWRGCAASSAPHV